MAEQRTCSSCSLCCKLLHIDELEKPSGVWCQHCAPGRGGCTIYEERPSVCQKFACAWLSGMLPFEHWFPLRAKMFVYLDARPTPRLMRVMADRGANFPWRREPHRSDLARIADFGLRQDEFHTVAQVGSRVWLIMPDGDDHEVTGMAYTVSKPDDGPWEVKTFERLTQAEDYQRGYISRR